MLPLVPDYNVDQLELVYDKFHKYFYSLYQSPFCDDLSDFLIDAVCGYLISQGKKVIAFSWERRNTQTPLLYPFVRPEQRLPCGHLNKEGTQHLYNLITQRMSN
jgi:hypothetical protein